MPILRLPAQVLKSILLFAYVEHLGCKNKTLTNYSTFFALLASNNYDTVNSDIAWLSIDNIGNKWRRDLMLFENNNRVLD